MQNRAQESGGLGSLRSNPGEDSSSSKKVWFPLRATSPLLVPLGKMERETVPNPEVMMTANVPFHAFTWSHLSPQAWLPWVPHLLPLFMGTQTTATGTGGNNNHWGSLGQTGKAVQLSLYHEQVLQVPLARKIQGAQHGGLADTHQEHPITRNVTQDHLKCSLSPLWHFIL